MPPVPLSTVARALHASHHMHAGFGAKCDGAYISGHWGWHGFEWRAGRAGSVTARADKFCKKLFSATHFGRASCASIAVEPVRRHWMT